MIRRWVFEGLLEDPHQEFFITRTALVEVSSASGAKVAGAPGGQRAAGGLGGGPLARGLVVCWQVLGV